MVFILGTDLTPYYLNEDDTKHFHGTLKQACDAHDTEYYAKYLGDHKEKKGLVF